MKAMHKRVMSWSGLLASLVSCILLSFSNVGTAAWPGQVAPYNYGTQFSWNEPPHILDGIQATGLKWTRTVMDKNVVNIGPGVYDFSRYDAFKQAADARGITMIFILMGNLSNPPDTQPEIDDFKNFAAAAAARYNGQY